MRLSYFQFFTILYLAIPITATGQDLPKAAQFASADWYEVGYFRFKPGHDEEGLKIIYDHFVPADKASGRAVISFDSRSGDWHHIAYFPLPEGVSSLSWRIRLDDEKWWGELAKQLGSISRAQEVMRRFNELLADIKYEIVMRRK